MRKKYVCNDLCDSVYTLHMGWFLQKYFAVLEKSCTFAPAFEARKASRDGGIAQLVRALDS